MKEILCRRFNPLTRCWEAKGLTSIPEEVMSELERNESTIIDLFYVIDVRDKIRNSK